jgi:L-ascorbate metabolism protein UlaG (beta-lactamase superfamily)
MEITWYGQSAFLLRAGGQEVFIDPFGSMEHAPVRWDYPAISGVSPDLLLVTHEHVDHNEVGVIDGDPHLVRSLAGRFETPIGDIIGVSAEHDPVAGTERGWTSMYVFEFDGVRVAHLGDLGQNELRPEQVAALGNIDLLFVPVGGGPTLDGAQAKAVVNQLGASIAVPMHYRSDLVDFLEPADDFVARFDQVGQLESNTFEITGSAAGGGSSVVVPATPPIAE